MGGGLACSACLAPNLFGFASEATGCEILGKAEFLNPGQSVKDRAALWIVRDAEKLVQGTRARAEGRMVHGKEKGRS